jgi:hypothetical protein
MPGEPSERFFSWQALVAVPRSTKRSPCRVDQERMHRMIAGDRHAGNDDLRFAARHHLAILQRVGDDLVVGLGVELALVDVDAGAAVVALGRRGAETFDLVGLAVVVGVLQSDEEPVRPRRFVAFVISAAPGVDVERAVRGDRQSGARVRCDRQTRWRRSQVAG